MTIHFHYKPTGAYSTEIFEFDTIKELIDWASEWGCDITTFTSHEYLTYNQYRTLDDARANNDNDFVRLCEAGQDVFALKSNDTSWRLDAGTPTDQETIDWVASSFAKETDYHVYVN